MAATKPAPRTPAYLTAVLKKHATAYAIFRALPSSHKREYIEWIASAKTQPTRDRRIDMAIGRLTRTTARD
jgi:uncharacterized protein YdeI (YjbR/CyaY-like superfamily)